MKGKTQKSLSSFSTFDAPIDSVWGWQENGWMTDAIGVEWFQKVFLRHCGTDRPQLLILDSHSSHEVIDLLQTAREEYIHIYALPPHTTHLLQPLDKVVFAPLKRAYNFACTECLCTCPSHAVNKASWPRLFKAAWEKTMREEVIKKAFSDTGIYGYISINPNIDRSAHR